MKKIVQSAICIVILVSSQTPVKAQKYLFSAPRQGGFKFKSDDRFDITNPIHFAGTGMLAVGFHKVFESKGVKHSKLKAGLLASGLGLLKEFEDGYREGWGLKDVLSNELGVLSFLLIGKHLHYTATVEQVVSTSREYGIGIRYFRTSEVTRLKASLGMFAHYNSKGESEAGVDLHFLVIGKTELHLGFAFIRFHGGEVFPVRRLNLGMGFKLL